MEWPLVKALLWALVVFLQIQEHRGCFEEERIGLLKLKAFLKSNTPTDYTLPSWSDHAKSDCCGWKWVTCNSTTGRVIDLSLGQPKLESFFEYYAYNNGAKYGDGWLLNVSLFMPFKELKSLDLSSNAISGCLPNEGFEKLSSLRNLKTLNIGFNYFDDNSILQSLVEVTSLETLNLTYSRLDGHFPTQGSKSLSRLKNLKIIDLTGNKFGWNMIQSLSSAKSIKILKLASNSIKGSFPAQELSNLDNLEELYLSLNNLNESLEQSDLSWNPLDGSLTIQDSKSFSGFKKLKTLYLANNHFPRSNIESLGAIKFLKNLNLASNFMGGSFPAQELSKFENLEKLDLSDNSLNGSFPVQGLANFSRLEILDLTGNRFTGSISPSIRSLSSLKAIKLALNSLNGTLPTELCLLTKLEELDLSENFFEGIIPPCLNNMASLRLLDISGNHFSGNISPIGLISLKSLEYVDFSGNDFHGLLSFSLFANHSKLQVIKFDGRRSMIEIETENPVGWEPLFQLKVLLLSECRLNKLTGKVPTFLFGQHKLESLDLSHNQLKGSFPVWLIEKNIKLQLLRLWNNSFVGKFHLPPHHDMILIVDVSYNHLDGQLQKDLGKLPPNLKVLDLAINHFEGYLPSLTGEKCSLEILDLSYNNFSGDLPKELVTRSCPILTIRLNNNRLTGPIPTSLSQFNPYYLDFRKNMMTGTIPTWVGNKTLLSYLFMGDNFFHGHIPCELGSIVSLDLSHNLFSGSLPPCLNLQRVLHLRLQGNRLKGLLPKSMFNSSFLSTLDLGNNNFFGRIPDEVGDLSNLRILLLRGNLFSGTIPSQICWLKWIDIMDLSTNKLSEAIPHCFNNMSFGKAIATSSPKAYSFLLVPYGMSCTYQRLSDWESPNQRVIMEWDTATTFLIAYPGQLFDVEFVTKYQLYFYGGQLVSLMSGLDLSCNKLIGKIPLELMELSSIKAINISYNQLIGSILEKFSNLVSLESLDLSHNNLSGEIPPMLIDLYYLEVFTVAYNNLSGRVPDKKAQFSTFDKDSYEGNPFLCGPPLENSCIVANESHPSPTKSSNKNEEKWYKIYHQVFLPSFTAAYLIFFFSITTILYINPYWQQRCFSWIDNVKY